ncbi:MAG: NUDIX domain-containing protein [Bacteroidia bacterium]|nr:NUDIX domain-containing protein [Bacteroidia bacterium]
MKPSTVRPVALCVIRRNQEILVQEGYDSIANQLFYRPPGGGIEFGEYSWDAVRRELKEELNLEIDNLDFMGALENVFTYEGLPHHELIFLFAGESDDSVLLQLDTLYGIESDGSEYKAVWMPISTFQKGKAILYPDGLLDMLTSPVLVGARR